MEEYVTWLRGYFSKAGPLPDDIDDKNYFEARLIDSFGVVELIDAVEAAFGITFDSEHFEQRRFATIRGLAEIIQELRDE